MGYVITAAMAKNALTNGSKAAADGGSGQAAGTESGG
jgi:hypothetical protein